jgi:hypothetical protein
MEGVSYAMLLRSSCMKSIRKLRKQVLTTIVLIFFFMTSFTISEGREGLQVITVDLSKLHNNIMHGAIGGHYALNEDNTPDVKMLKAIKPITVSQMAPGGLQHPGGDAFKVAKTFKDAGGKFIQVYLQDIYPSWPYDNVPIEDYYDKVEELIEKFKNIDDKEFYVLIPFNEPDAIWFNNNFSKFLEAWEYVFKLIKKELPNMKIAGPNFANFNEFLMDDFMTYCKIHSCIPDIITWHELNDSFFFKFEDNIATYRQIEKKLGISRKEIIINEYGRFADLGVPGQLIKWIAKLEREQVYGGLAFWHIAGNFDDLVVENQKPNGAWWLYKWYSDMEGQVIQTTLPEDYTDGDCLAIFDKKSKQIRILVGGTEKNISLFVKGFDKYKDIFGEKVKIKLFSTEWSGQQGELIAPPFLKEEVTNVANNRIKIDILNPLSTQVFYLIITPFNADSNKEQINGGKFVYNNIYKKSLYYEAEEAETNGTLEKDPNYFCSGNWRVMLSRNNYLKYDINSPETGEYEVGIFYSTHSKNFTELVLRINNQKEYKLLLPPTISKGYIGKKFIKVFLKKGENILEFVNSNKEAVSIDSIEICETKLKYQTYEPIDLGFEGEIVKGNPQYYYDKNCYIAMNAGDRIRFVIVVPERGFYSVAINSHYPDKDGTLNKGILRVFVNNQLIKEIEDEMSNSFNVLLEEGVNIFELEYDSKVSTDNNFLIIKELKIKRNIKYDSFIRRFEAEDQQNGLYGKCVRRVNNNASGNWDVTNIGLDNMSYIKFNDIKVPEEGMYKLILYYANSIREGNHPYNIKIVDICGKIKINGNKTYFTTFRYTGCDKLYYQRSVDVYLEKGTNYIEVYADKKIILDKVEVGPIVIGDHQ